MPETSSVRTISERCDATRAAFSRIPRSERTLLVISGRCTLTATLVPSWRNARCTCAVEAAANGSGSKEAYSSSGGAPNSSMIATRTWSLGNDGTSSCRRASSSAMSAGRAEAWLETIWPILT